MTDMQERQLQLDFEPQSEFPGYRLHRIEVYNWGTFDRQIWRLNLDGKNGLLTGDIGSGKSTLVDAITTLLIQRAAYNKAAGAEAKERSLKSYVHGYYKNERNDVGSSAKPVALRDNSKFSVILAVFHNAGFNTTSSIAQIFWTKDPSAPLGRLYVCSEKELSVSEHFHDFRGDVAALRRKLAGKSELFDSFKEYSAWFRRRLDIKSEQALDLFHQTVSMKSVSNLTDFVRTHMLESLDVESRIKDLIQHFDALTSSHDLVLKAKRQVQLLTPIVENCSQSAQLQAEKDQLEECRKSLKFYFGRLKLSLLDQRIEALCSEWARQDAAAKRLQKRVEELRASQNDIRLAISANGGDRIQKLKEEINQTERESLRRQETAGRYVRLLSELQEKPPNDTDQFITQRHSISVRQEQAMEREPVVENELTELEVKMREKQKEHLELSEEVADLRRRRSNIPREQIRIRDMVCDALKIAPNEMPFAGELLQVHGSERDWEGAAERLLRGFGLSILVPDKYYDKVSAWVDRNHLRGRLVYFRVRSKAGTAIGDPHPKSLFNKISIKPDTPFYDWLESQLSQRANYACCETQEEFRRELRAITVAGQIKKTGEQHEKDDRSRIDDRSRFVLGWSNEEKILVLQKQIDQLEASIQALGRDIGRFVTEKNHLKEFIRNCQRLEDYPDFEALDWQWCVAHIAKLRKEIEQIETTSDVLKQLNEQLESVSGDLRTTEGSALEQVKKLSKTEQKRADLEAASDELQKMLNESSEPFDATTSDALDGYRSEALGEHKLTLESCDPSERATHDWLLRRIAAEQKKLEKINTKIVQWMSEYNKDYPLETQEVDASIESADEYTRMLKQLQADDLPRFEARFKQLLNENTINEVANFRSQLDRQRELIKERIDQINQSLTKVPYNEGRFIRLEAQLNNDADIRDFQTQLRACTENTLTGSDDAQYSEAKFLQVKEVVQRFRGREGQTELDRRWTARVTDVRNWFSFAASERWLEDGTEFEHYSDSSGKSGGQKEKLAYTILAASLAYQFGLEWGVGRSRAFRFVVIDEAFGRGSDESAQYGLKLFQQLNLQLLVVTPLQKIHIIEPYVAGVGYVQNEHGNCSKLRNLTIAEYHERKAEIHRI